MIFKNITDNPITCYGYKFMPDAVVDVKEPDLIRKFSLYHQLIKMDIGNKESQANNPGEVSRETLKSQAIAAGMKVDGRWSETRLREEMDNYMRGINEPD